METSNNDVFIITEQTLNNTIRNNYNLDTSIVNLSSNINSYITVNNSNVNLNATSVNSTTLQLHNENLNCIDFFKNGSCLINSQLSNESQLLLNDFAMPLFQQLIWSFIFGCIVFVASAGNCIICWIILFHKRMRSVTNFHLCMYFFMNPFIVGI